MATTDRMSDLNSRRELTDRLGETVVLGNSVEDGALEIPAQIVAAAAGESEATSNLESNAISTMDLTNGSFGIWAVFADLDAAASFSAAGGSIRSATESAAAVAALSFGTNAGGLIGVQVFTATGAYTPTAGTVSIVAEVLGGGGGGGGASNTSAGQAGIGTGGGAGGLAIGRITSGFSGTTVTVGAGGAGAAAGGNNGTAGGASAFGSVLFGGGGAAGLFVLTALVPAARYGDVGGSASGSASLVAASAQRGQTGYCHVLSLVSGGAGACSLYGAGGVQAEASGGSFAGGPATGYGAGGGGAAASEGQAAKGGGAGSQGIVIIYEYNT